VSDFNDLRYFCDGGRRTENPGVGGSIPSLPTSFLAFRRRAFRAVTELSPGIVTEGTRIRRRSQHGSELGARVAEIALGDNRVAPVHRLGLVARELHRDRPRDARALKVPHGRAPEVVEQEPGPRRALPGCPPKIGFESVRTSS
jgi:hypothetical protein